MDKLQISDEELAAMQQRYAPLVLIGDYERYFYEIEDCDPRNIAYAWSPTPTQRVKVKYGDLCVGFSIIKEDSHG